MERIGEYSPALGAHLEATIRTGTYCAYVPDPRAPIDRGRPEPRAASPRAAASSARSCADPPSRLSRRMLSLGAWAWSSGWVKPSSTTGSPRTFAKLAPAGIEPPSWRYERRLAEDFLEARGRSLRRRVVDRRQRPIAVVELGDVDVDALRRDRHDVVAQRARRSCRGSMSATRRHETLACAWAGMIVLEPSPWKPPQMPLTSSVGRAPLRSSGRKSGSPKSECRPCSLHEFRLVERQPRELLVVARRQRANLVVEAGHGDRTVVVLQPRDDRGQRIGRVLDVAAERARVQVHASSR